MNLHALSVDVEEYFQVEGLVGVVDRSEWDCLESRVVWQTDRLLDLFARERVHGTFFTLGWVARRHPDLIRRIVAAGHELACHGDGHEMITRLSRDAFRADLRAARATLEDLAGVRIDGYRAPTFSVVKDTLWALDVLREEGFRYDASVFPIRHDRYGIPDAPRHPHRIESGEGSGLVEFPSSTMRVLGRNLPVGGGGYLRLLPMAYTLSAMKRVAAEGPCMVYLHPWEIDAAQPRFATGRLASWRGYHNLDAMEGRLATLLRAFSFASAREVLASLGLLDGAARPLPPRAAADASV
jgi:polysaccharide deacetylase family protein (PEP-CTERM system associated)